MAAPRRLFDTAQSFRLAFPLLVLVYLISQITGARKVLEQGDRLTTDDAMRLVEVRDLLAGQPWYDLFQHRVLPPDGLSMHWSRYIDAPMAALMAALDPLVGADMAARWVAVIWPLSLGVLFMALTARLAARLFGHLAATIALVGFLTITLLFNGGFGAGATDHHSVQIILMLILCASLVLPDHPVRRGITGGLAAALSLAVGLEMILFIAAAGIVLVLSHALCRPESDRRLLGFSAALALTVPVLMAGQLDPALWSVPVCDAISPPLIALTGAAFVASGIAVAGGRYLSTPLARLVLLAPLGAATALLLLPILQPCLAGPYTAMSPEIQRTVLARVQEIKPALYYLTHDPARSIALFYPLYVITLLYAAMVVSRRGQGAVMLGFLALGAVLSFWQTRMGTMALPVIAITFGAACAWAIGHGRRTLRLTGLVVFAFVGASGPLAASFVKLTWTGNGPAQGQVALGERCMTVEEMRKLDAVPAGIIFNPLNLGPLVLLSSAHSITSAPYHRSTDAFANGILPYEGDEAGLRAAIDRTRADYLLFCAGDVYGPKTSIGTELSKGGLRPWLAEVPLKGSKLRLLRVLR